MDLDLYDVDVTDQLLRHIGHEPHPPSVSDLTAVQHRFLDAVPYENLDIQLGRPGGIDPVEAAQRIMARRGGYCFHLNGAFAALLVSLGYEVSLARGKIIGDGDDKLGNHMFVLVRLGNETWLPDVALGDGYRDPLPLREDVFVHPPFSYGLERLDQRRWRFRHDELATIEGMEFDSAPAPISAFEVNHAYLSTSPDSSFVRKLVIQQRRADHTLILRGCVLLRTDGDGRHARDIGDETEWWSIIGDEFGLNITTIESAERAALWRRIKAAHDEWNAAGRP